MIERIKAVFLVLIDDFLILAMIFLILPFIGINLPFWLILTIIVILILTSFIFYKLLKVMEKPPSLGREVLIGKEGIALTDINPIGIVEVENESWTALSLKENIQKGNKIKVIKINGVKLIVIKKDEKNKQ